MLIYYYTLHLAILPISIYIKLVIVTSKVVLLTNVPLITNHDANLHASHGDFLNNAYPSWNIVLSAYILLVHNTMGHAG